MKSISQKLQYRAHLSKVLPVIFGFFIMGFVDLIGVASNYVKMDFSLSDSLVNLISLSCFFWFLIVSIPTGLLMNRIGRKKTVLFSYIFTFLGLLTPCISYSFVFVLVAFAFIGIGNAIIQVALNPLVINVVSKEKLTGTLTLGQFTKAISSFLGPIITSWFSTFFLDWKYIFPVFALITLLSGFWLWVTPIKQEHTDRTNAVSFASTISLLKDRRMLFMFIGILVLVGVDVGMNITLPKYIMEKCDIGLDDAILGNSVYFFVRTISAFIGGVLLMKYSEITFFKYSALIAFMGLISLIFSSTIITIIASVIVFGVGYANLFAIIFSLALKSMPEKANECSSLLIVGVSGGAIITPILGVSTDIFNTQSAAMIVLLMIWVYIVWMTKIIKANRSV
jgi:MFS transporter, FHS family, L-fucose permease